MSPAERAEDEEMQRSMIIRKSLTSRSMGMGSSHLSDDQSDRQSIGSHNDDSPSLREEWKEWEANAQRERSSSPEEYPSPTSLVHPVFRHSNQPTVDPTNPVDPINPINPVVVLPHNNESAAT